MLRRIFQSILLTICLLFLSVRVYSSGNIYWGHGSQTRNINVANFYDNYNPTWCSVINNSIITWNSYANVTISISSTSPNYVSVGNYGHDWSGLFYPTGYNGDYITGYIVYLNYSEILQFSGDFSNVARSVCTHEFGHAFWLDDNPPGSNAYNSLMNGNRDRNVIYVPQTMDINNVNAKYP